MSQQQTPDEKPIKILWFGDLVNESGFGRIGNEVTKRMVQRGWNVIGASVPWMGYPWNSLPYPVWGMAGHDIWNRVTAMARDEKPDVIVCCQDFPYSQTLFHGCKIDFSVTKLITITPIDGTPIHPAWLEMVDMADATMVISKFGVEAMRLSGKQVGLLHPGVNDNEFYPAKDGEVKAAREKVGIAPDAFVLGMFAMNQGRKGISITLDLFAEFCRDKPEAILYMDMDKASPAGWDIPTTLQQIGLSPERVKYREDAYNAGLTGIRDRYLLLDVHSVIAHREGFGLPLLESMACRIPTMALDWCSGTEIVGQGKGMLVRRLTYMERGTWGGARDAFPDMKDWLAKLNNLYHNPDERQSIAVKGHEWAIKQTWDVAADQFEKVLKDVVSKGVNTSREPNPDYTIPAPSLADGGPVGGGAEQTPADPIHSIAGIQQPATLDAVPKLSVPDNKAGPGGDTVAG